MNQILIYLFMGAISLTSSSNKSIYDYEIEKLNSDEVLKLSEFKGKKILIVNVASKCGYTPQYEGLQALYEKYQDQLAIIGFPCNQFMWQENGSEEQIAKFCKLNYGVTFPITTKINVKGSNKHPIYNWLTSKELNDKDDYSVSWNFNKFLISEKGELLEYYSSKVNPMDESILKYLR